MNRSASLTLSVMAFAVVAQVSLAPSARASSGDAWAEFAANVKKACLAAVGQSFVKPKIIVDPFGSERYGLAIITGKLKAGGTGSQICVYGKQDQKAEVGSELGADVLKIAP